MVTVGFGTPGMRQAIADGDIPVIVDVLRFSSAVTTAVANGFTIIPAGTRREALRAARLTDAVVSGPTEQARFSLSPLDYLHRHPTGEVIIVSPNGAALARMLGGGAGFVACFLNARAAGHTLSRVSQETGRGIALIAAGEATEDQEGDLEHRRFAVEDYLGCGAILAELAGEETAEAGVCHRAFDASSPELLDLIRNSQSGRYLVERGQERDIAHCVQRNIYDALPVISNGRIRTFRDEDQSVGLFRRSR